MILDPFLLLLLLPEVLASHLMDLFLVLLCLFLEDVVIRLDLSQDAFGIPAHY